MRGVWLMGFFGVLGGTVACTGDLGGVDADDDGVVDDDSSSNASSGNSGTGGDAAGGATSSAGGAGGAGAGVGGVGTGGNPAAEALCARWNADRQQLGEGSWSGSVGSCDEGDISATGRANALRQLNLYRFIASMPEVVTDPTRDGQAQECALMMHANNALSHNPPMGWDCYSGGGASAAGSSNIASGPGVMAVDMYMSDFGNETTMGHRRWILNNRLGPVGLGSTSSYSCMWVIGGSGNADFDWMAWPSAGVFPIEALTTSFQSVDSTGWTLQSNSINLSGAQVTVTDGGQNRPVSVASLLPNYGSNFAIKLTPQGWTSEAGHTYHVEVTGIGTPISYDVEMVQCE